MSNDNEIYNSLGRIEERGVILLSEFRDFRKEQKSTNTDHDKRIKALENNRSENRGRLAIIWVLFGGAIATIWGMVPKVFSAIASTIH